MATGGANPETVAASALMGVGLDAHVLYFLAWVGFAAGHSLFAGEFARRALPPEWRPWHRVSYNVFAGLHLLLVLGFGLWLYRGADDWQFPMWFDLVRAGLLVSAGTGIIIVGMRGLSLTQFLGLDTVSAAETGEALPEGGDREPLIETGLRAYVRHPQYVGAMMVFWGIVSGPFTLMTAIWASLYFIIGSRLEEVRLEARHGDAWRAYRARVPAFIPRLSRARNQDPTG